MFLPPRYARWSRRSYPETGDQALNGSAGAFGFAFTRKPRAPAARTAAVTRLLPPARASLSSCGTP